MGFIIQFECPDCGYRTPDETDPKSLIDPLDMPNFYICECCDCQNLFQRAFKDRNAVNRCVYCGGENIIIHPHITYISCPKCHRNHLKVRCLGTFF